jgi:hypothetical protein
MWECQASDAILFCGWGIPPKWVLVRFANTYRAGWKSSQISPKTGVDNTAIAFANRWINTSSASIYFVVYFLLFRHPRMTVADVNATNDTTDCFHLPRGPS